MGHRSISLQIADIVGAWEGVTVQPHRFGGLEFRVQQREIGHLHGERVADFLFSVRERRDLVASGRARAHAILPDTGWVSLPIRSENDIPAVIELMRRNYNRLRGLGARARPQGFGGAAQLVDDRRTGELPA